MKHYDFVIVGGGSSGRTAAETLAEEVKGESILLINAETVLPYKRTKVSKNVKKGYCRDEFAIHVVDWYRDNRVDLINGQHAVELDYDAHTLRLDSESISYSALLLATGARPCLPFHNLPAGTWSTLWTVSDGLTLHRKLGDVKRVAIVGVGVLGVEAAWQSSQMGLETVLVGRNTYPMMKYLDSEIAGILEAALRKSGVSLMLESNVTEIIRHPGGGGVLLKTEKGPLEADYVILSVGSRPDISLASASGIRVGKGIRVDSSLKTSAPDVWAAGDCAEHPGGLVTGLWHSAEHQGYLAALGMLDRNINFENLPYRLKCEVFGGFWFSAGPVNSAAGLDGLDAAESWDSKDIFWKPRFKNGKLAALTGAAPEGMEKNIAREAQNLVLKGADRDEVKSILT